MKAIFQEAYGSADVLRLREVPTPAAGDDGVLVRVRAAGVDPGVWHLMTGLPYLVRIMGFGLRRPKHGIPGMDLAGVVEHVGKDVTRFGAGDAVFGAASGAFAEYAVAREDKLAPKPDRLSFEQAAALPTSGLTALQAVRDVGGAAPGRSVLVVGAAGGVGTFAVQIAKALGAEVTGVCSAPKADLVRSLGADGVIDYTHEDFADGRRRWDTIVDLAGNRPLSSMRRALAPRGTLVIVGGEGGGRWLGGVDRQLRALVLSPFVGQHLRPMLAAVRKDDLVALGDLVDEGKLTPVVDRTFALGEAAEAIRAWESGDVRGKVVLTV